jgi:RNA polymerase sigma-70 factor (ECF subfamily)
MRTSEFTERGVSSDTSDRTLLDRIHRDDPGAFDQFVETYGDRIYGFGMRVCGEREDARDVAQDTLLQAFRSIKSVREPGALRSWLYRVASNACLMKRRKGKHEPQRELSLDELMPSRPDDARLEIPDVSALPDLALERSRVRVAVREAIEELPPHYRIVLVLRDMEQLSTREVAEALDLPETTVKMRLHRARLMVRRQLEAGLTADSSPEAAS